MVLTGIRKALHRLCQRVFALYSTCALLSVSSAGIAAQGSAHLEVRGSVLPISGGNATVGSVQSWAWTLGGGVRFGHELRRHVEVFYTQSPSDTDSYNVAPRIHLGGILAGASGPESALVSPLASLGVGLISVQPARAASCEFPCIDERSTHFGAATLPTVIGRAGIDVRVLGAVHMRLDTRVHLPLGGGESAADSDNIRFDFGAAVHYRF